MPSSRLRTWLLGVFVACAAGPGVADAQLSRVGTPEVAFVCSGPLGMKVEGTGDELKDSVGGQMIEVRLSSPEDRPRAIEALTHLGCGEPVCAGTPGGSSPT